MGIGHRRLGEMYRMDPGADDTHVLLLLLGSRSYARWADFAEARGWAVVTLLSTGQVLRELRAHRPQLVVAELSDPQQRSLRLLRLLRVRRPGLPVIAVPTRHTRDLELTVREIGAAGYVPAGCGSDDLDELVTAMLQRAVLRQPAAPTGPGSNFEASGLRSQTRYRGEQS